MISLDEQHFCCQSCPAASPESVSSCPFLDLKASKNSNAWSKEPEQSKFTFKISQSLCMQACVEHVQHAGGNTPALLGERQGPPSHHIGLEDLCVKLAVSASTCINPGVNLLLGTERASCNVVPTTCKVNLSAVVVVVQGSI